MEVQFTGKSRIDRGIEDSAPQKVPFGIEHEGGRARDSDAEICAFEVREAQRVHPPPEGEGHWRLCLPARVSEIDETLRSHSVLELRAGDRTRRRVRVDAGRATGAQA